MKPYDLMKSLKDAITLSDAAKEIPLRPSAQQVHRWSTTGVRGVQLATWLCGGKRVTTRAAIEDFLQALNRETPAASTDRSEETRRAKQAGAALDALLDGQVKTKRQRQRHAKRDIANGNSHAHEC